MKMPSLSKGADWIYGEAAFEILAKAQALERNGKNILHFEIGEPDMDTPDNICQAAINAIHQNKTKYVPSIGLYELREAVVEEISKNHGFEPSIDQVVITPGLKPGIFFAMLALVNPGDQVIYPDPGYPTYGSVSSYLNAEQVKIPLLEENNFRMNPDDIKEKITNKTKLVIINSPQNPTGSVMTKTEMEDIAELAEEHDFFIISDEIYSKMTYDVQHVSPVLRDKAKERCILLDGFSKYYAMTGWRLGYMIAPEKITSRLQDFLVSAISCTTSFIQWAGIEALKGDQQFIAEMMDRFKQKRDLIVKGLNSIKGFSCTLPQGAFYAFPNITKTGLTSQECADRLLYDAGIAALPGTAFGPYGEGYVRFSYATSIETIDKAIGQIKETFE